MRRVRALGVALGAFGLLGALGACSQGEEVTASPAVSNLVTAGHLTVCSDMPYAPFESMEQGKPVGFDIDLVTKVADRMGVSLVVQDTDFDDIQSGHALNARECDLVISAMTITGDRARVVDFSSPYFNASQALVVRKGSGLADLAGLAGRKVGVQGGTTGEVYLTDHAPASATIVPLADSKALNTALVEGQVEAAFYDNTVVAPYLAEHDSLEVAAEFDTGEQYGMAVKKDGNPALLRLVNDVLADAESTGEVADLHQRWFGADAAAP